MRPLLIPASLAVVALSCGGDAVPPPSAPTEAPARVTSVEVYLPLKNDTVFAYDTESENTGERGILVMQVTRPRPGRADLKVGNSVRRLEIVEDGIRLVEGGYLLKAPLSEGTEWVTTGGRIRVTAIDKAMNVPAGQFTGCIETTEVSGGPTGGKRVTTVFCPEVGIVMLDVEGAIDEDYVRETATLKSHGPRVDIGATEE